MLARTRPEPAPWRVLATAAAGAVALFASRFLMAMPWTIGFHWLVATHQGWPLATWEDLPIFVALGAVGAAVTLVADTALSLNGRRRRR